MSDAVKPGKPSSPDWRSLHLWEIQPIRDLMLIAAIIGLVYVGYIIRIVTVPMLLALLLAYLFEPLMRWLRMRNLCSRRTAALGIILLVAVVVVVPVGLGAAFAIVKGSEAAGQLASTISKVQKSVDAPDDPALKAAVPAGAWTRIRDFLAEKPLTPSEDGHALPDAQREEARAMVRRAAQWAQEHGTELGKGIGGTVIGSGAQAVGVAIGTVTSIGFALFAGLLTAFFFYFFSTSWGGVLDFWEGLIPEKKRGRVMQILSQMDRVIAGFVRGRLIIVFILMIFLTLGYWIIGVPSPYILGPVVGALFIVPYVSGLGLPIAMLLLWFGAPATGLRAEWWWIIFAPIALQLLKALDDYILTPRIQGKTTDLSIPTILFASLAGGALAGVYGLLIAIPAAACIRILMKEVVWPRFRRWAEGKETDFLPIGKS